MFFRKKYTPDENVFVTESNVYDVFENLTDLGDIGDVGLTVEDTLATEIRSMRGEVVRYTELVDYGERIEENNKYWDFVVTLQSYDRLPTEGPFDPAAEENMVLRFDRTYLTTFGVEGGRLIELRM